VLQVDGELEALRMRTDRREALTRRRVQTVNRLQALLAELLPGQAKRDITTLQAKAMLASVRPRDIAGKTRRSIAVEELAELVAVEAKIKKATAELKVMVLARGSRLMDLRGVGPVVAARVLADVGDVARFAEPQPVRVLDRHRTLGRLLGRAEPAPALPSGQPPDQPHDPHRRGHPDPTRHRGSGLLPTQAGRGQEAPGGDQVSQAQDLRRHLPPSCSPTNSALPVRSLERAREGTAGRLKNPAWSTYPRTSTLRISHFPDPQQRRYAPPEQPGRAPGKPPSRPPVDNRGEPEGRARSSA